MSSLEFFRSVVMLVAGAGCLVTIWVNPDVDQEGLSTIEWATINTEQGGATRAAVAAA